MTSRQPAHVAQTMTATTAKNNTTTKYDHAKQESSSSAMNKQVKERRPPMYKVWIKAARPHTLTAAFAPVLVGYHICMSEIKNQTLNATPDSEYDGSSSNIESWSTKVVGWLQTKTLAWLLFCVFVQLGTNLHNDYADFVKGADDEHRVGQARATQKGWLTPQQTATASTMCLMVTFAIGIQLSQLNTHDNEGRSRSNGDWDWFMVGIVVTSVFNAFAYTGGPYPLGYIGLSNFSIGYSGLGDLFVFLYFGLVATMVLPYLYARDILDNNAGGGQTAGEMLTRLLVNQQESKETTVPHILIDALHLALPVGWLATAIIVVNNLRDRHTDIKASKFTTSVRFGGLFSKMQYALLVLGSYGILPIVLLGSSTWDNATIPGEMKNLDYIWCFLPYLTVPMAIPQLRAVSLGEKDGADLNPHVGGTALLQMAYCIFLSISLRMLR